MQVMLMLPLHAVLLWGYSPLAPTQPPPWRGRTFRGPLWTSGAQFLQNTNGPSPHRPPACDNTHPHPALTPPCSLLSFPFNLACKPLPSPGTSASMIHHGLPHTPHQLASATYAPLADHININKAHTYPSITFHFTHVTSYVLYY